MFDLKYQYEAGFTLSNTYHGQKVTMAELSQRIAAALKASELLDQVKKALFYGKGEDLGLTASIGARNAIEAPFLIANVPIPLLTSELTDEEKADVKRAEILLHMALGKFTEAGEFLEAIFKAMNGEAPPDDTNLLEEIGDGLWYDANALTALGSTFAKEMGRNNAKLRARFPAGFTEHHAINRDLDGERDVLEQHGIERAEAALERAEREKERFARRCNACGLENGQHRPECENREKGLGGYMLGEASGDWQYD